MAKTPLSAPVERAVLNKEGFLTIRKKLSSEVQTVFTAHDTYIGVIGNEADLTVNGALAVTKGATGVYKFPDGTCSIRGGENTSVVMNPDGSVTIDTVEGHDVAEILSIANDVNSRLGVLEERFDTVQAGFDNVSGIVNDVQSKFTVLSSSVASYDSRIASAESSVANVIAAESAQNSQISSLRAALNTEVAARITQGTNFLSDVARIDGKITQEVSARTLLSSSVFQAIDSLSSSFTSSITGLSSSLASRVTRLEFASSSFISSINVLGQQITDEANARTQVDDELNSRMLSLESLLSQEALDRQVADQQLSGSFASSIGTLSSSFASRILSLSSSFASDITDIRNILLGDVDIDFTAISSLSSSLSLDINDLRSSRQGILNSIDELSATIASLSLSGGTSRSTAAGVFAFNEVPQGSIDGVNTQFTLSNTPSPPSSLMLFYNGQLMTVGNDADYVINGNIVTFLGKKAPDGDDLLLATYFYSTPTKSYKFNESVVFTTQGSTRHAVLDFTPDPPSSLMLFLNGQLLKMGGDYDLSDRNVTTDIPEDQDDVFLATYSHN